MALDSGFQKKLQIFLVAAIVIAGGRRTSFTRGARR